MKKTWMINIIYYFSILTQYKLNIRAYLVTSVFAGLMIPLANILFLKAVIIGLTGEFYPFGMVFTSAIQLRAC